MLMRTMTDTHASNEMSESALVEDVSDHAVGFALIEATLVATSHDTTCILTSVLKKRETFVYFCSTVDVWVVKQESENAAHG